MLGDWIRELVSNYSIDGLRLDTTINIEPDFFPDFVDAAGVFATGETMDGDNRFVCRWADTIGSILNYPIYYPLIRAFSSPTGSIGDLVTTMHTTEQNCDDPTAFGTFSENHDVPRFTEYTNDTALAKNILAYTVLGDGIPIIYQGQEQHLPGGISPPMNRAPLWTTGYDTDAELYRYISALVHARRHFIKTPDYSESPSKVIYQDYHNMAMAKGTHDNVVITILQNNGASAADFNITLTGPALPPGTVFTELLTCTTLTVARNGTLNVPMKAGLPRVLHPQTALSNSGLCGTPPPLPPPPPSTTTTPTPQDPSPTNRASHTVPRPGLVAAALALFVPFTLEWLAMH
jgi:alpha-amylase